MYSFAPLQIGISRNCNKILLGFVTSKKVLLLSKVVSKKQFLLKSFFTQTPPGDLFLTPRFLGPGTTRGRTGKLGAEKGSSVTALRTVFIAKSRCSNFPRIGDQCTIILSCTPSANPDPDPYPNANPHPEPFFSSSLLCTPSARRLDRRPLLVTPHISQTMLSPAILTRSGVRVCRAIQRPRSFVVTFPNAYHAGFRR